MSTAKVLPDAMAFEKFTAALLKGGFRRVSPRKFKVDHARLGLEAPSPRRGREEGFTLFENGLEVVVWTTFLADEGQAREIDSGWVLIKDGDEVRYFSHPVHRTKWFLRTLFWLAIIAKWRIEHRPLCPTCKAWMRIKNGKGMKARFWQCSMPVHKKPVSLSWDHGLPEPALKFLRVRRKRRARYNAQLRKEGKRPGAAIRRRKPWKVRRPQNLVPSQ